MNFTTSCSVCGHIHDHTDENAVDLAARTCGDCGYCLRAAGIDADTRGRINRYFDAEPAALTVTLERRDNSGVLLGFTIAGRNGSVLPTIPADREAEAVHAAELLASRIASKAGSDRLAATDAAMQLAAEQAWGKDWIITPKVDVDPDYPTPDATFYVTAPGLMKRRRVDGWLIGDPIPFNADDYVRVHHHEGRACACDAGEGDGWL
jgi:hypothetical protein